MLYSAEEPQSQAMKKVNQRNRVPPSNLPSPLNTFIGREREIVEVKRLLSSQRLSTLTGAGGSGKTRLALKIAEELSGEFEHGIWFVELASIFDPDFVPQIVASLFNIREQSGQSLVDVLISYLSARHTNEALSVYVL
jgi:predicted ATPase